MDYSIHDLPESERPREKLEENGVEALSDAELLAILLRTGIKGKNVKELSFDILNKFSLHDLVNAEFEEFKDLEGISDVKAGQLKAIGELGLRLQKEDKNSLEKLSDVKSQVEDMRFYSEEKLRVFYLNSGNEILFEEEFEGTISMVEANPRKILGIGLRKQASAFILAHNHPSGKSEATPEDVRVTEELLELGKRLGLDLLDHVIVGDDLDSMRGSSDLWQAV